MSTFHTGRAQRRPQHSNAFAVKKEEEEEEEEEKEKKNRKSQQTQPKFRPVLSLQDNQHLVRFVK